MRYNLGRLVVGCITGKEFRYFHRGSWLGNRFEYIMLPTSLTLVKLALRGRLRNTRLRLRSTGQLLSVFLQILEW